MNNLQEQLQSIKIKQNLYDKKHKNFYEQIELLKSKGLIIQNEQYAIEKLKQINYYRLSAYFIPLQYPKNRTNKNIFLPNTTFESVLQLYYFDRELRKIIFESMEFIEIYFRAQVAYYHAEKFSPYGYLDINNFTTSQEFYENCLTIIKTETNRSEEEFVNHFSAKYKTTDLPIWALVEVISFGSLSKIYSMLKTEEQKKIVEKIKGINNNLFKNWLHSLSVIRNICAHHSRLWNRTLGVKFEIPNKIKVFREIKNPICCIKEKQEIHNPLNDKIFFALSVIEYILICIGEDEIVFKNKIKNLLKKYKTIDIKAMGFIKDWETLEIWKD